MKVLRINIWLIVIMVGVSQAYAQTSAMQKSVMQKPVMQKPVLVPQEPVADLSTNASNNNNNTDIKNSAQSPTTTTPTPSTAPSSLSVVDKNTAVKPTGSEPATNGNSYPLIGKMEVITFGKEKPNKAIEERLTDLEKAVFRSSFEKESLFDRTQKLQLTILGASELEQSDNQDLVNSSVMEPFLGQLGSSMSLGQHVPELTYFELMAQNAENQSAVEAESLPLFALQQINNARAQLNLQPLVMDKIACIMAEGQIGDLHKRRVVSHLNSSGENPDLRYTNLNGKGTVIESVIALKPEHVKENKYTRALVAHTFKLLIERQDDRESLLSPDATGFGFALRLLPEQKRALVCVEVSTNHGTIAPLLMPLKVGDKIEIEGNIQYPYQFAKLTLAWEGLSGEVPAAGDENEEALPYFPPLDYVGYKHKGEHDYSAAMGALRMGCLVGVLAGSMFMPPVALAAPLIMMTPSVSGELKPVSDIPLHGGVKVEGNHFLAKIPVSHANKPGIYYITVWATTDKNSKPIPISRRAYSLTEVNQLDNTGVDQHAEKVVDKAAKKTAREEAKVTKNAAKYNNQ